MKLQTYDLANLAKEQVAEDETFIERKLKLKARPVLAFSFEQQLLELF